jgi:hypothetical protein
MLANKSRESPAKHGDDRGLDDSALGGDIFAKINGEAYQAI